MQSPKYDCIQQITDVLIQNKPYVFKTTNGDKTFILFAADTFRRRGHEVHIDIQPTQYYTTTLVVIIHPLKSTTEYTLCRDDNIANIISKIEHSTCTNVTIRACGMAIKSLFAVLDWAVHNGWYVDKTFMSTITQLIDNVKQRNTTLHVTIKKG